MEVKIKQNKFENYFFVVAIIVAFIFLCVTLWTCFFETVWIDEVYSMSIIKKDYFSLLVSTSYDVHPPLYYFILKFFVEVFGGVFVFLNPLIIAKFVSMLALIIVFYFSVFKLSKLISKQAVGLFLMFIFSFSTLKDLSTSVRMYSWTALFLLLQFYFLIKVIKFGGTRKNMCYFVLFFELCAYSHNYSLVAGGILFAYLGLFYLCERRNELKSFMKYLCVSAIIYLPWFFVLLRQIGTIHENYWISEFTIKTAYSIFEYFLIPNINLSDNMKLFYTISFVIVYLVIVITNFFVKHISKNEIWIMFAGSFVTFFLFMFAIVYSFVVDPIFVARYTDIVAYIFYLSFIMNLVYFVGGIFENNVLKSGFICAFLIVVCVFSAFSVKNNFEKEKYAHSKHLNNQLFFKEKQNSIFVFDVVSGQTMFSYQYDDIVNVTYCFGYTDTWWRWLTKVNEISVDETQIKQMLIQNKEVLFFGCSQNSKKQLNDVGIELSYFDKFLIGEDLVDLYVLKLKQ